MLPCLLVLGLALAADVKEGEDGPIAKDKWKSDYTEKTWGLKVKTVKYTTNQSPPDVNIVFEFTKDLKAEELKALKEALSQKEGGLEFCFFDEDGVIFAKAPAGYYAVQGDLSGMKGDAIRCRMSGSKDSPVSFIFVAEQAKKVSKVEFRPALPK
jgi:hypothetical protein